MKLLEIFQIRTVKSAKVEKGSVFKDILDISEVQEKLKNIIQILTWVYVKNVGA